MVTKKSKSDPKRRVRKNTIKNLDVKRKAGKVKGGLGAVHVGPPPPPI